MICRPADEHTARLSKPTDDDDYELPHHLEPLLPPTVPLPSFPPGQQMTDGWTRNIEREWRARFQIAMTTLLLGRNHLFMVP